MTYDSYEEAKIANPHSEIVTTGPNWKYPSELKGKFERLVTNGLDSHALEDSAWVKCDPSKYCMTVERFLADGYEFVEGDLIIGFGGKALTVHMGSITAWNDSESDDSDSKRYILRAAALEEKNPRTKVEYVKVEYVKVEFIKLSDAAIAIDAGDIQFNKFGDQPIDSKALALHYCNNGTLSFYRRIETPIEWWEDALQLAKDNAYNKITVLDSAHTNGELFISASMTRDQWCDFARILLEQGE